MSIQPSPRRNRLRNVLFCIIPILILTSIMLKRRNESRPQIDVRNIGATSILLRHKSDSFVVLPSRMSGFRFSPGDTLTLFAGETESAPSKTVSLQGGSRFLSAEAKVE